MAEDKGDEGRGADTQRTVGLAPAPTYTAPTTPATTIVEGQVAVVHGPEGQGAEGQGADGLEAEGRKDNDKVVLSCNQS